MGLARACGGATGSSRTGYSRFDERYGVSREESARFQLRPELAAGHFPITPLFVRLPGYGSMAMRECV